MKKKFSISFIALAAVMLLVSGFVPHHHHNAAVCMIVEHCEIDHSTNDGQTDRHADDGMKHASSCIVGYYALQTDSRIKCKLSSCDHCDNHVHPFPILCLFTDCMAHPAKNTCAGFEYGEYVSFYISAEASQFHGLRAPPCMLS
ncbi:MAG: hypothetical protein LBL04_06400 [Bacteroidales bacterium]|nr:hypothetical protein [Bacteroidales bacterium]